MRRTKNGVKDSHGVIHVVESYAKEYAWTMCGQIYPHHKAFTRKAPTCLTCIVIPRE